MTLGEGVALGLGLFGAGIALATLITRIFDGKKRRADVAGRGGDASSLVSKELCQIHRDGIANGIGALAERQREQAAEIQRMHSRINQLGKREK